MKVTQVCFSQCRMAWRNIARWLPEWERMWSLWVVRTTHTSSSHVCHHEEQKIKFLQPICPCLSIHTSIYIVGWMGFMWSQGSTQTLWNSNQKQFSATVMGPIKRLRHRKSVAAAKNRTDSWHRAPAHWAVAAAALTLRQRRFCS